jgi:PAS domain S-box-containing protein
VRRRRAAGPQERLRAQNRRLRSRLREAEQALEAIRTGQVESLVVEGPTGVRIYALEGATHSYRVLVEAMSEGAATIGLDGTLLYCNARLARMLGAPLERVIGSPLTDWAAPGSREALARSLAEAAVGAVRLELELRAGDGEELPVLFSASRIEDEGRSVLCAVVADLREQQRQERLVASERFARSVLEQAADAIVVCDAEGRVVRASHAAERLCGRVPLRLAFDEAFPVEVAGEEESAAAVALGGRTVRSAAGVLRGAAGAGARLLVSAAPLHGPGEQIEGCVVTLVDVTAQEEAERRLAAVLQHYRTLFELTPSGVVLITPDGRIQDFNEQAHAVLGYGWEEFAGLRFSDLVAPGQQEAARVHLARVLALGGDQVELQLRTRGGEPRELMLAARRVDVEGHQRILSAWRDITARKRAEETLREVDRNKTHFLAMLSHELRNPLVPIRNSVYILEKAPPGGELAARARAVIERQTLHMSRLIDDLLDVTRISRGKVQLALEPLDLSEVVRRTVEDHRPAFEAAGVALAVEVPEERVVVRGDRVRLAQVLGNLLHNAAKFTPRGGHAWVSLARDAGGGEAVLRVKDDGAGIAAPILPRLFEPFIQADATLDRSRGGLGLGLSLVRALVELHGGAVTAASPGPDLGAEFAVRLPLSAEPLLAGLRTAARGRARRRVLVIEDNLDSADTVRAVLELAGHAVEVAHSGPDGLARALTFAPEVVLCDLGLPGLDGFAVARALRGDPRLRATYLVALSGYAGPDDVAQARAAGFDRHLAKPADAEVLQEVVANAAGLGAPDGEARPVAQG